ncbi:MAG TPA: HD domain-containing protein [Anaerolineales bacterium]|nr:HD domain-containing protein [Anaerolineales bacterium]
MPTVEQARTWYPHNDTVHGFDHVLRVLALAERLGNELRADLDVLRAAALLHDASGAAPGEGSTRSHHEQASAEFARQVLENEAWPEPRIRAVEHCIRSHRYRSREAPATLEAEILFDADKLDVVGAFGVARTIAYAMQAGEPIFAEPSEVFLRQNRSAPNEPHSAYHEYLFKLRHVAGRLHTRPARRWARRRERVLTAFFEQLAAEARGQS